MYSSEAAVRQVGSLITIECLFRSIAVGAGGDSDATVEQYALFRLRRLDAGALPKSGSCVPRAGFGIDFLPAWKYGLRWDCAVETVLRGV